MRRYITTITIITLLLAPFVVRALPPIFVDDGGLGDSGSSGGNTSGTGTTSTSSNSNLFVQTDQETNVTYTTARLHGTGGDKSTNPTLPLTGYFRYSKAAISPIFCNDIYGSNMISTRDINLGATKDRTCAQGGTYPNCIPPASQSFYQNIGDLTPDTTYYYCAIVSNKNVIAYGGNEIVRKFHTSPYGTTVRTSSATNIESNSVTLNGSYSSIEAVKTYFEYKETTTNGTSTDWKKIGEKDYNLAAGGSANIYGNINVDLTELAPSTRYQFRAVATNKLGIESKTVYGSTLNFITSPSDSAGDNGTGGGSGVNRNCSNGATNPPACNNNASNPNCPPGSSCSTNNPNPPTPAFCQTNPTDPSCNTNGTNCMPGSACNISDGTWTSGDGGSSGTWGSGTGSGTWRATSGTGGTGIVTWTGTGNGSGTWRSSSGSGTWTNNTGTGGAGTGTWTNLVLGQNVTPPDLAIVRYHEGIETVFARQIVANQALAQNYGYQSGTDLQNFAWYLADEFAKAFGYIDANGKEIRVSFPDIAAYQLQLVGNKLTVYEYYANKIVDIRNTTATFKNKSDYEYYFKK